MDLTILLTREWRPGSRFGRRLRRLPPPRPSPVPLYSLGTAARIERLRSWYAKDHLLLTCSLARPPLDVQAGSGRASLTATT
jgi:hypothetical protein